jgi:hypothetical protein
MTSVLERQRSIPDTGAETRKRKFRIPQTCPWAPPLAACLDAALAIPPPT